MKKTLKEYLNFFGVEEGDVVKLNHCTYKVTIDNNNVPLLGESLPLQALLDEEYSVVKPKKVGELRCGHLKCDDCPFAYLDCYAVPESTSLYEGLKIIFNNKTDNLLYKVLKEGLDKNVDTEPK